MFFFFAQTLDEPSFPWLIAVKGSTHLIYFRSSYLGRLSENGFVSRVSFFFLLMPSSFLGKYQSNDNTDYTNAA